MAAHADALLDQFGRGIYAAYLPIRSELSPLPLIARLADLSIQTAIPITPAPGNPLDFRLWATGDKLDDGPYDTKQPSANAPVCQPDVILAPMLAFDGACWRLGYGGGFYDRSIGGMRQAGVLAAAGLYALDHHIERLASDHDNALRLAEQLAAIPGVTADPAAVETNMVFVDFAEGAGVRLRDHLAAKGMLIVADSDHVRLVTHLDCGAAEIDLFATEVRAFFG